LWRCDATALERAFKIQDWGEVVSLYGGEFLTGLHVYGVDSDLELWIEEKRRHLRECAHVALWKFAEQKRSAGQEQEAILLLRQALALDLFDEVLLRQLVELLHERGDRAGAIEVYERFASRLRAELEVEPDRETQNLIRSIRVTPAKKSSEVSPPDRTAINYRDLPVPLSPLVGRRSEVELAVRTLQRDDVRLVSITGAGGMGKTRVALEAAAELAPEYEGVCFVPLAPASGSLHDQLAQALNVEEDGRDSRERVVEHLSDRRVLLVLDNFENVLAEARAVSRLLSTCPAVTVLITSICPLRIPHESEQALQGLQIPAQDLLLGGEWPLNSEAVAYFLQCAESVDRRFRITERNANAILRVCRAVDGIPLAIALAAARLRELPVHALADRLESGVALLGERHSTRPERHRTMAAAIDWTTQSLEPMERELFYALSLCDGAFSVRAAEFVARWACDPGTDFWPMLEALTERGLIKRPESEPYSEMLMSVRVEARGAATQLGKADAYRAILLRYYCTWLRVGHRNFCSHEEAGWLCAIDREYTTIQALLQWGLRRDPVRAARLVHGLWYYWWNRGLAAQGYVTARRLLKKRDRLSSLAQGKLLVAAGNLAMRGEQDEAVSLLQEAVELFRDLGNRYRLGWACQSLGIALREQGSLAEAARHLQEALEIGLESDNTTRIAFCQQALGKLAYLSDATEEAEQLLGSSLRSAQARNDWSTAAWALTGLGDIAAHRENPDEAAEYYRRAMERFEELGQKIDVASTLERLARVSLSRTDHSQASSYAFQSLGLYQEVGYTTGILQVLVQLARQDLHGGNIERGITLIAGVHGLVDGSPTEPGLESRVQETRLRAQSQCDEETFNALWRTGGRLSLDELVSLARAADRPITLELARQAEQ
jgi:predicted ATPase